MQKGFTRIYFLAGLMLLVLVSGGIFYLGKQGTIPETAFLIKGSEGYCRQFSYRDCPSNCEVRSSCPVCMDTGCHAKDNWQVFKFEKSYKNGKLKFSISYPKEWRKIEGDSGVRWYYDDKKRDMARDYPLLISWRNPNPGVFYKLGPSLCQEQSGCRKVVVVKTKKQGLTIEIWKPGAEVLRKSGLLDTYLQAKIEGLDQNSIIPEFSAGSLKVEDFQRVLSTFNLIEN